MWMVTTNESTQAALFRYWLTESRDFDGGLANGRIRIAWDGCTAVGDVRDGDVRWYDGDEVPAHLHDLAVECALDAFEHGVARCDFQGFVRDVDAVGAAEAA